MRAEAAAGGPRPADDDRRSAWGAREVGFGVLWFLLLFIIAPLPIAIPFVVAFGEESSEFFAASLVLGAGSEVGLVVVAAALSFRKYGGGWQALGFRRPGWSTLGWAVAALVASMTLGYLYAVLIDAFGVDVLAGECDDQLPKDVLNNTGLLVIAGVVIVSFAPVCEEVFFRGFAFPGLARSWGMPLGIAGSALVFSVAHLGPALHKTFVPILAIGLVFAFCYWRSGNILSTILAHLAFNSIAFAQIVATECE
jgi:membrane protease YdiL (CAAX protease family)